MEQKSRRYLLSIVFMLAMVIGLVTGMSMTTHAGEGSTNVLVDVGEGHASLFNSFTLKGLLADLQSKRVATNAQIFDADDRIIILSGINKEKTKADLQEIMEEVFKTGLSDKSAWGKDKWIVHNGEFLWGVGYKPLDEYATVQDYMSDIASSSHRDPIGDNVYKYYLLWAKPFPNIKLGNGNPTCGMKPEDAIPTLPDGTKFYEYENEPGDGPEVEDDGLEGFSVEGLSTSSDVTTLYSSSGYSWEYGEDDEVVSFEGGKEYVCHVKIRIDWEGAYWKCYFNEGYQNVSVSGGKVVEIDPDEPQLLEVSFKVAVDHVWDAGKVTKEPTTTAEGVRTYKCKHCDATKTEAIPKKTIAPIPEDTTQTQQTVEQITIARRPGIKKPNAKKMRATVYWNAFKRKTKNQKMIWKQIKGIEVQYSMDPAFPKGLTVSRIIGRKKTKLVINGLQRKTAYFVRVRYTDGEGGYSNWSKVKKLKTK